MSHRLLAAVLLATTVIATPALVAGKCSLGRIAELPITMSGLPWPARHPAFPDSHRRLSFARAIRSSGAQLRGLYTRA